MPTINASPARLQPLRAARSRQPLLLEAKQTARTSFKDQDVAMRPLGARSSSSNGSVQQAGAVLVTAPPVTRRDSGSSNGDGLQNNGSSKGNGGNGAGEPISNGSTTTNLSRRASSVTAATAPTALAASPSTTLALAREPASNQITGSSGAPPPSQTLQTLQRDKAPLLETVDASFTDTEVVDRPSDGEFAWSQERYSKTQRTVDTWTFFTLFRARLWLLDQKWSYLGGYSEEAKAGRSTQLAKYLVTSLLNLGPTFIKLGQLSSTRSDLFPAPFVAQLAQLQDRVPAFSGAKAIAIIERELGQPIDRLFASFDPRPIAAASLGQVHRAVLLTGEEVVVKVQRPGLKQLFDLDLANLKLLAEQLDKGDANRDFRGIYKECADVLYQEIDYVQEGRNADRFRRNFQDTPWITVPLVHWQYTSPHVMTMQYAPGIKISNKERLQAAGIDTRLVARRAAESYLSQVLRKGFFHADPHPGDLAVDPATGNFVYYDFGMMGEIVPDVRQRLLDVFYGIYKQDSAQVVSALTALKVIKPTGDTLSIRRSIGFFIQNLSRQVERKETVAAIGEDLFAIALDQPFRFPSTFTFVLRAFSTLEGIGKGLDPEYNFATVAAPYAKELLELQEGGAGRGSLLLSQVQQQATELGQAAMAVPLRVQRIDSTLSQLEAGDLKLRVRVLEAERAARRMGVMQVATINTVGAVGMLNVGTMLALEHINGPAALCLTLAGVFSGMTLWSFRRVKRLDKFESDMKG